MLTHWLADDPNLAALKSVLKSHKINGSHLTSLTVDIVRSFGVCYGDAGAFNPIKERDPPTNFRSQ